MDARGMVESAFDRFEKVLMDLDNDGGQLARVSAAYRGAVGRFKVDARLKDPKDPQWYIDAQCDADSGINELLQARLELENLMFVHRERLYKVKKELDQGRSWGVDERTADQITANWGDVR